MARATSAPPKEDPGIIIELVFVTPELAQEWMTKMVPNRRLYQNDVDKLATDMTNGDWRQTGDVLRFNKKGQLNDGQHRLAAIIQSGKTIPMYVARGIDAKAMDVIDTGRSRSFADILQIKGVHNSRKLAAVAKALHYMDEGRYTSSGPKVSHSQLERTLKAHPFAVEAIQKVVEEPTIQPHAQLAMVYCLAHEKHPRRADQWLAAVQLGENISRGNPAYELRRMLQGLRGKGGQQQMRGPAVAAAMVQSWNGFFEGRDDFTQQDLKWRAKSSTATDPFPVIK